MSDKLLFLLIHGTWAPKSKWSYPTSPLGMALDANFKNCQVDRVQWSGANSFSARLDAAKEIERRTKEHAGPVVLIAHSHGGSAAMYALRDHPSVREKVKGAVFMSTPYMAFALRPGYRNLYIGLIAALYLSIMLPTLFLIGYLGLHATNSDEISTAAVLVSGVIAFLLTGAPAYALYRGRHQLISYMASQIDCTKRYETTRAPQTPILILRSTGDEVALGLGTLQLLATVSGKLSAWVAALVSGIVSPLERATKHCIGKVAALLIAAALVAGCVLAGGFAAAFGLTVEHWIDALNPFSRSWSIDNAILDWTYRGLLVFIDGLAVLLGSTLLLFLGFTILAWATSVLALWGFGEFSPTRAFWFEYAAEPLPFGSHTFNHIAWDDSPKERVTARFSLRHSEPYADANAIKQLLVWVEQVCK